MFFLCIIIFGILAVCFILSDRFFNCSCVVISRFVFFLFFFCVFFFFKQKTAYEMRISDWSSDVCSSDLPIGNFRLQKAVYFARRKMGEHVGEMAYLRKAAGPYNPSMKYSGGIAIAKQKNWLREARGRFGFGHVPGPAAAGIDDWFDKDGFGADRQGVVSGKRESVSVRIGV